MCFFKKNPWLWRQPSGIRGPHTMQAAELPHTYQPQVRRFREETGHPPHVSSTPSQGDWACPFASQVLVACNKYEVVTVPTISWVQGRHSTLILTLKNQQITFYNKVTCVLQIYRELTFPQEEFTGHPLPRSAASAHVLQSSPKLCPA